MTWFKVDDQIANHVKVLTAGNLAMGLWVRAGAWSCGNLTDGHVPAGAVAMLGGTPDDAQALVTAGLWKDAPGGFQFHDWADYQPTAESERKRREKDKLRKREYRAKGAGAVDHDDSGRFTARPPGVRSVSQWDNLRDSAKSPPLPDPDPDPETLMVTNTYQSPSVTREQMTDQGVDNSPDSELDGFNPWAVVREMESHGYGITEIEAAKIAHLVMSRASQDVQHPTAFILAAIRRDPHGIESELRGAA